MEFFENHRIFTCPLGPYACGEQSWYTTKRESTTLYTGQINCNSLKGLILCLFLVLCIWFLASPEQPHTITGTKSFLMGIICFIVSLGFCSQQKSRAFFTPPPVSSVQHALNRDWSWSLSLLGPAYSAFRGWSWKWTEKTTQNCHSLKSNLLTRQASDSPMLKKTALAELQLQGGPIVPQHFMPLVSL